MNRSAIYLAVLALLPAAPSVYAQAAGDVAPQKIDEVVITGQFLAPSAKSAMKQDLEVKDIPFTVSNYSGSFMKAIETTNMADLYSYMTGIQRGGVTGYDLSIRGFKTTANDKNAILVDGLPGLAGRFGSPPTVGVESIEVVKGPSSVLYGQAQPGGFVNIVTKKPKSTLAAYVDLRESTIMGGGVHAGHNNGSNIAADITGPLDSGKKLLARVIVESSDKNTFRDYTWDRGEYLTPSLAWFPTDSTSVNLSAEYRHRKNAYDNLLVAPNKDVTKIAAITTHYQEPADWQEEAGRAFTLNIAHTFPNDVVWTSAYRHVHNIDNAVGYDNVAVLADLTTLQRRARNQHNDRVYSYADTNLAATFKLVGTEHKFIAGIGGGQDITDFERIQFFNGPTTGALAKPGPGSLNIDIYKPVFGVSPPLSAFGAGTVNRRYTKSSATGVYFSDVISITDMFKLTLGVRRSNETQLAKELKTPPLTVQNKSAAATVPSYGLLFQPNKNWTLYTSYSTAFIPTVATAQDAAGQNPFEPEKSKQVEGGVKYEAMQGRLSSTFSVFEIHRRNTLAPIACNSGVGGTCSQQVGGEQSKGFEWEMNVQPVKGWQLQFGLARADAKIELSNSNTTAPLVGARLTNAPLNMANFWSRYDFQGGPLKNFGVGFGVVYKSEHTGNLPSLSDTRVLLLPSYTTADLGFYYKAGSIDFTLKFSNIFDKKYFEGVNSTTNELGIVPGVPRSATLSMRIPIY